MRLGFILKASIVAASPELHRVLQLENLHPDELPERLVPPPERRAALAEAIRRGAGDAAHVYVAPDAWAGHGLFASAALPAGTLLGEYVGTLL